MGMGDDYFMYCGVADPRFVLIPHDLDTILDEGTPMLPSTRASSRSPRARLAATASRA